MDHLYFSEDEIDMINYIKDVRDIVFSDEYDEVDFSRGSKLRNAVDKETSAYVNRPVLDRINSDRWSRLNEKYGHKGAKEVAKADPNWHKSILSTGRTARALRSARNRDAEAYPKLLKGDKLVNARNETKAERTKLQNARTLANKIRKATGNKK